MLPAQLLCAGLVLFLVTCSHRQYMQVMVLQSS